MKLKPLTFDDKDLVERFLRRKKYYLSAYAFENIIIWDGLYDISWAHTRNNLYIFFMDNSGCFLYLEPLGGSFDKQGIQECFDIMDSFNKNPAISRIENIGSDERKMFIGYGYRAIEGFCEYICLRQDVVGLSGKWHKPKRASLNFFLKNYNFELLPYQDSDKQECIDLYKLWMNERKQKCQDALYQSLLDDNFNLFGSFISNFNLLDARGWVIKIKNSVNAFTFGYLLSSETFVILFEVCNLNFKGIAQYIFRESCLRLDYKDINIMDDSGLKGLRRVKMSYKPYKIADRFVVAR